MDNRLSKGDLSKTALHEIKHAGDARKDPEGFQKETKSEKELDRDKQKTEQRADTFRDENADRIKKEVDDLLKQMHVIKAFEKQESK
jgi:ribosomal protein S25